MSSNFEDNRDTVLAYFNMVFRKHDPERAAELYMHEDYRHHGSGSGSSCGDFVLYFLDFFRRYPNFSAEVLQSVSDNDMVALRVAAQDGKSVQQKMIAEFYRLEEGKIKEHWHVLEE